MDTKTCTKCGEDKPLEGFPLGKPRKDGSRGRVARCRVCKNAYNARYQKENPEVGRRASRKYYEGNPQKARDYREKNRGRLLEYQRRHYADNQDRILKYRQENREAKQAYDRKYGAENRDKINRRDRDKYANDPLYRLAENCRSRLRKGLKSLGLDKARPSCEYIGCSWEELKAHLEGQFKDGMGWENHGEWHIDHIVPLCSATTEEELLKLTHYTNLQPLWAAENLSKGGRV